jgi:hypothetical protein
MTAARLLVDGCRRSGRWRARAIRDTRRATLAPCCGLVWDCERPSAWNKLPGNLISDPAHPGVTGMIDGLLPMPC